MKKMLGGVCCFGLLAFLLVSVSAQAATVDTPRKVATPRYDATKEITLEGNVSSVKKFVPKNLEGGHMFVGTPKGTIDAHLGPFALKGTKGVQVAAGDHVKMVGAMTTVNGKQVFLIRTVETGSKTYTIRNTHGIPVLIGATQATKNLTIVKGGQR